MGKMQKIAGLLGTIAIAGWVAYAVSAPRNVDNAMNEPMEALEGSTIGETLAEGQANARQMHCDAYTEQAQRAWDRAVESNRLAQAQDKLDELDRKVKEYCG